jgi:rod shape-determining protein MreC
MKNIFSFIRRYFAFVCFVILQALSIMMLSKSSNTHDAFFSAIVNEATGKMNKQYENFYSYFTLKAANKQLAEENAKLRDSLHSSFIVPDNRKKIAIDTTVKDSLGHYRKFTYLPAKVVSNTITSQNNYLTLERGALQGVYKGMSVVGPQGIVGTVIDTSANFCRVMSVLHRKSTESAMLKKDNTQGSVEWDGKNPSLLTLRNIPKSVKVEKGDSVVTSNYSVKYPSNIMIGTIDAINTDPASNFYILRIKTATNFYTLQYVYLVDNVRYAEQVQLESKQQKNNE